LAEIAGARPAASRVRSGIISFKWRLLLNAQYVLTRWGRPPVPVGQLVAPDHLEVLLAGLSAIGNPAKTTLLQAINSGGDGIQKARIIAALPENPDLLLSRC